MKKLTPPIQTTDQTMTQSRELRFNVVKGKVLGVSALRGFAPLNLLSEISKADIYDHNTNPTGTQRDLSPKHARDAYNYIRTSEVGFWPEVFLNARLQSCWRFEPSIPDSNFGTLVIDLDEIDSSDIAISRVDGNHRLHFADGHSPGLPAIKKEVSFCLAINLGLNDEIKLFRDINDNQRRMNTSHLDNIQFRLSDEESLKRSNPALYIAKQLGDDPESPLYERVYDGGVKGTSSSLVPLRSLRTGLEYMFSSSSKLGALPSVDAQYNVVRNFFLALRLWVPAAFHRPSDYLLLRGAGLWAACFVGAHVIDRVLMSGRFTASHMHKVLRSGRSWDWSRRGDFKGYSGRGGAVEISKVVTSELQDDQSVSLSELSKIILENPKNKDADD